MSLNILVVLFKLLNSLTLKLGKTMKKELINKEDEAINDFCYDIIKCDCDNKVFLRLKIKEKIIILSSSEYKNKEFNNKDKVIINSFYWREKYNYELYHEIFLIFKINDKTVLKSFNANDDAVEIIRKEFRKNNIKEMLYEEFKYTNPETYVEGGFLHTWDGAYRDSEACDSSEASYFRKINKVES